MNFYIENKNAKYVDKLKKQWYIIFVLNVYLTSSPFGGEYETSSYYSGRIAVI